ncbi:hypothetical protein P5408_011020 [Bacillus subtilis]|nr:hypothetical protein [Bacillus subtilis]MDH3118857.1 hypothetical protein [Bacillus subtilis]RPK20892.1 hypothetical protein EH2_00185 [Bacillus subtilis]
MDEIMILNMVIERLNKAKKIANTYDEEFGIDIAIDEVEEMINEFK